MTWTKGLDLSFSPLTDKAARDLRAEGYEVLAQCLWTGVQRPFGDLATRNLDVGLTHGFAPVGYISINGSMPPEYHVEQGMASVPDDIWRQLRLAPIDVELAGIPAPYIRGAVDLVDGLGKGRCIYTARWYWLEHQANRTDFADCWLWSAHWDSDPDIDFGRLPYGGWSIDELVGEQFSGGADLHGVWADEDMFRREILIPEERPMDVIYNRVQAEGIIRAHAAAHQLTALQLNRIVAMDEIPLANWMEVWKRINGGVPVDVLPGMPKLVNGRLLAPVAIIDAKGPAPQIVYPL